MKFGIKQKMLIAQATVLVFTVGLTALLASYYIRRQNEEAAFADIGTDLIAWRDELSASTSQLRRAALAVGTDQGLLDQLAGMLTAEMQANESSQGSRARIDRTVAYTKTVSLNRLYSMLQTGAFSSIAVYTGGQLSHYVSASEVGMFVRWQRSAPVWLRASIGPDGSLPLQSWPAWTQSEPPKELPRSIVPLQHPTVMTSFPTADTAAIDFEIPLEGVARDFPSWWPGVPAEHVVSDLAIRGTSLTNTSAPQSPAPTTVAVILFRKRLDAAVLRSLANKTRKWPALFSPDGERRQELTTFALIPQELLTAVSVGASQKGQHENAQHPARIVQSTVETSHGSFYAALLAWHFEGHPRFVLGFALSRDKTLENVRQTVIAIVAVAGVILLLSLGLGAYWVDRFTKPVLALTRAVNKIIGPTRRPDAHRPDAYRPDAPSPGAAPPGDAGWPEASWQGLARLEPIDLHAPDEIGALARAFNTMLAELRRSFDTLEQRVLSRTAELRQQTHYLRTLLDTLPTWVCLKNTQGRYLAANEPMARVCGLSSADEMVGKTDTDIFPPERAAIIRAEDAEVMSTKRRMTVEEWIQFASYDKPVWVERFRAPVLDDDGTALGVVHVSRDISAQKAADSARETALAEAMRLARLRSEFLARVSHELRTPLNAILGYAQLLRRDKHLSRSQVRGLATIHSSGEHLLNLINDILDLTRIDAGRLDLAPTALRLEPFLEAVADIVRVKAREKSLRFRCEARDLPQIVQVDAMRLRQVLLNLLSNAVKFTDTGEVALYVTRVCAAEDDQRTGFARLRFDITDSGIGLSSEELVRLFQPFEQLASVDRRAGGVGLGLAISQQLVQLMGGQIRVESEPGRGSRFFFELALPLASDLPLAALSELHAIGYEGPRRSVLVVDDLAVNVAVLMDMLVPLGFQVTQASDGEEALAELERRKPDLIIMDIVMPRIDGLEATRRIRGTPRLADVPIIAVSASASQVEVKHSLDAGVNAFVAKPIDCGALLRKIGELLQLKWILEEEHAMQADGEESDTIAPSSEELDLLHELALEGNMRSIRVRADHVASLDEQYRPFAMHLKRLAESYQSQAILAFIEKHRHQTHAGSGP